VRHKVDFGFQVAYQNPLSHDNLKSTLVFKSHSKVRSAGKSTSVAYKVRSDGTTTSQAPRLDAKLLLGNSSSRGLHSNYYSRTTLADFARSQVRGLYNNYSTWLIQLSYLRGSYNHSTQMMDFANIEDPWIDYLIISRLGGCYATPIIQFFQDGRFRIKIDPQLESATQPKAVDGRL
jgi:hypothetical protein